MEAAEITNPTLWAQIGGLNGLVIFALFVALALFLRSISKVFEMHRNDFQRVLEMHAKERQEWGRIVDERQKETNLAIQSMAAAIHELNMRSRRFINGNESN